MAECLKVRGLVAGYGATVVLEDIDLDIPEQGSLAILGRNGVGKTTLLATIMGHTTLHSGSIVFDGQAIERLPVHERARLGIGYVPQTRDIFPSLTVEENLMVAEHGAGDWSLDKVYEFFPRLLERRGNFGNQLSGGEQQMLSIGRALMGNPKLLILDEPLEGLSPIIVDVLMESIRRLLEDKLTVILVEQSARRALQSTQEVIVLDRGRITWKGQSGYLLAHPDELSAIMLAG
ncbi:ABC transporter ATP-binding protein [Pusillimonas noertemannii]|uniref:Branched-chain amino acid transport system ATP-binding protein n=1 Tax=Pusillimonas noertemannii TaxID=305977 RepID=A0A2U1CNA2_9BURK|nr:ABC transporter ATP-binding protein [Pusillimonas noertemannii]NYT68495.1 ABC transporter ATP-binding protein [Pusillimonas noertemannii]PVY62488.1 branched-chain amino acid transport system ATP-binding protein [Pusillimonas noertemannii]TFL10557.1 ABC transporter ATP-binding protein [Pusillimonas noertemannii]